MDDFRRDDDWQRNIRDTILAPQFYGKRATDGRYVFMDKGRLASVLQKRYAVDTILQGKGGDTICIEEKIVRWPTTRKEYTAFALETNSCTKPGHESDGWMVYGQADYLFWCFEREDGGLRCFLIDFPALKEWFWPAQKNYPVFGPLKTLNATKGSVVPIKDVRANVATWGPLMLERMQRDETA
jgi:hypothetical protein